MNCPHCGTGGSVNSSEGKIGPKGVRSGYECGWRGHIPSEYQSEFLKLYSQFLNPSYSCSYSDYEQLVANFLRNKRQ